jgi:hypothetical protein
MEITTETTTNYQGSLELPKLLDESLHSRWLRAFCITLSIGSVVASLILLLLYREMGGPGDQLAYYEQAAKLTPFTHIAYGPAYFVVIRLIHDIFHLDWFLVGKLTSWVSAVIFLLLCYPLFKHFLPAPALWPALALVAVNPVFIGESYDALTIMFASSLLLGAIVLTLNLSIHRPLQWILPGLLFGAACLTRIQSFGLLGGALLGVLVIQRPKFSARLRCAAVLAATAVVPIFLWNGFLLWSQGYIPRTTNYKLLASALENVQEWNDVASVDKYDGLLSVLTSSSSAPFRIAAFAAKSVIKFPFTTGYGIFFIASGWLIPGAIVAFARRETHGPALCAFAVGLVLTGIGSLGWLHYYVVFIPFGIILIAYAIDALSRSGIPGVRWLSWGLVLASTVAWAPAMVSSGFSNTNWPEFTVAREFLEARRDSKTLVSTTAASFSYGTTMAFIDMDDVLTADQVGELVPRMRQRGITDLIITERHTLFNFPQLKYLLNDSVEPPPGLSRELLIKNPRRLAIYRVDTP